MPSKLILQAIPTTPSPFPPFANVSVLLHGDGSFTDNSFIQATFSATGGPSIAANPDTVGTYNDFSTDSIEIGAAGYLSAPDNAAYALGSTFTVEAFLYLGNYGTGGDAPVSGVWFDTRSGNGNSDGLYIGFNKTTPPGEMTGTVVIGGNGLSHIGEVQVPTDEWVHLAIVAYGNNTCAVYINGVRDGDAFSFALAPSLQSLTIGQDFQRNDTYAFNGFLNEIRVTKGVAVYSGAAFTPPTAPFPNANP